MKKYFTTSFSLLCRKYFSVSTRGFTLVELIISIAIIGVLSATFVSFSLRMSYVRARQYAQQEVNANARVVLDAITRNIRQAKDVDADNSLFGSDDGELWLVTSDENTNPTIFYIDEANGALMFQQGSNAPEPVTSKEVVLNNFLLTDLTATSSRPHIGFELNMSFFNRQDTAYAFETNIRSAASIR